MPSERAHEHDEAIDRYWDELVQGRAIALEELNAADEATIRYLHEHDDRAAPDALFLARLREDLAQTGPIALPQDEIIIRPVSPDIGPIPHDRQHAHESGAPTPARGRWFLTQFATAALLALTLVAGFLALGRAWPWERHLAPAVIPAIDEPPAKPETGEGPIAQFLWQSTGGPNLPFAQMGPPAIDPQGNVWIPDAHYDQFLIFDPDGTFLEAWGQSGSELGEFEFTSPENPSPGYGGVAFDAAGNIYVLDTGNYRIQKFAPDRSFLTTWGGKGNDTGQFRRPAGIAIDGRGRVYISDEGWGKIEVFAEDGSWIDTWSGLGTPNGLAIGPADGDILDSRGARVIWVADLGSAVIKFSATGERLATWQAYGTDAGAFLRTVSVAVALYGRVYVADMDAQRVQVFAPDGTLLGDWGERGTAPGQFLAPYGVALDGQGDIYVVELDGNRIQKFRLLPPPGS